MKIFINSNTSLGCLHSKDVALHARSRSSRKYAPMPASEVIW